jgi:ribosome recycling factor
MMDETLMDCEMKMEAVLESLKNAFKKVRTGRATTEIFDAVKCDYYGAMTPVNQMCNIVISDAATLLVKPFDRKNLSDVEKAIHKANLGLSVVNDGVAIRVQVPALTEERRRDLVAEAKKYSEEARVRARDARREANKALEAAKKEGLGEDEIKKGKEDVNQLLKKYEGIIDKILKEKSEEILAL